MIRCVVETVEAVQRFGEATSSIRVIVNIWEADPAKPMKRIHGLEVNRMLPIPARVHNVGRCRNVQFSSSSRTICQQILAGPRG